MSFQSGLSGLKAASETLSVISNNVANAGTKGFKRAEATYEDIVSSSGLSSSAGFSGIGVAISSVRRDFGQGTVSTTNNPLDLSINGDGFFVMDKGGSRVYSRNGEFYRDASGFIRGSGGAALLGFQVSSGSAPSSGVVSPLRFDESDSPPRQTTSLTASANLDSRSDIPSVPFSASDANSWNSSLSSGVYDSLGNVHAFSAHFVKTSPGNWDVYGVWDGASLGRLGSMSFDASGYPLSGGSISTSLAVTSGAVSPLPIVMDFSGLTQFGSSDAVFSVDQDGVSSGTLTGFSISQDGIVVGNYSNGATSTLGRVALSKFASPNGLVSLGDNLFAETSQSGQPLLGSPGAGTLGNLSQGSVEESNVDLTKELVDMIVAQRAYQANAQSIKTQDQIMQTLVNLR